MAENYEFLADIQIIGKGSRYQINVPIKAIKTKQVDPTKPHKVILIPINNEGGSN